MTDPRDEPTRELPAVTPSVSTAPPQSRWHWSAIPSHLGRARTSTVVLALLFLAVGALYLNVKPPPTGTTTTGNETGVQQPVAPATVAPTRTVPRTTTETATETTTSEETTTSRSTPSTSGTSGRTTTPRPTGSSATNSPARTSVPSLPTTGGAPTT